MAETLTPHYSWTKPDIGGDASIWGNVLNATTDAIDSVVYANQQAGVPIGSVTMFAGVTPPTNWLICDGRSLDTTAYAALFAVLQYAYGGSGANFSLPNLQQKFPLGAGPNPLGQSGGSLSATIAVGNLPAHAHLITDVQHSHTAQQNAHSHVIATGGHSHGIVTGGHAHGPGSLLHFVGSGGTQGVSASPFNVSQSNTDTAGNLGGNTDTAGNLGGNTDAQQPAVGVNASGTGLSTTQNVGSGTPLSVVPPFVALNFIIRCS